MAINTYAVAFQAAPCPAGIIQGIFSEKYPRIISESDQIVEYQRIEDVQAVEPRVKIGGLPVACSDCGKELSRPRVVRREWIDKRQLGNS